MTPPKSHQGQLGPHLTVVVDAVDQANPNLGVVVGHEDDVEELLAVGVELPELSIHRFQRLQHPGDSGVGVSQPPPGVALTPLPPSKTLLATQNPDPGYAPSQAGVSWEKTDSFLEGGKTPPSYSSVFKHERF